MVELPQPVTMARPKAELPRDFVQVEMDRCTEPRWHFKVMVRRDAKLGPQGETPPTPKAPEVIVWVSTLEVCPMTPLPAVLLPDRPVPPPLL